MRLVVFVLGILLSFSCFAQMPPETQIEKMPEISGETTNLGDISTQTPGPTEKTPDVVTPDVVTPDTTASTPSLGDMPPQTAIIPDTASTTTVSDSAPQTQTEKMPDMPRSTDGEFSQLFTIQGGTFSPRAVVVSNGDYKFNYGSEATQSYTVEAGWAIKLFRFLGAFHLEENLDFTGLQGQTPANIRGVSQSQNLNLYLMGLDTRIMYSMEWFPWKRLIPFVDGGYRYTFYSQSGPSDLESAQGRVGNAVGGIGFRFWLNRGSFTGEDLTERFTSIPIFLTGKYTHIFPSGQDLELSSDAYLGGLAIAL